MSLKVTDVQAALRHFRSLGHDILSDTRAVHLDGNPYRIPLGHHLNIATLPSGSRSAPVLSSYVSQVEGPLISEIQSIGAHPNDTGGNELAARSVSPLVPSNLDYEDYSHYSSNPNHKMGSYKETSTAPPGSLLWKPYVPSPHHVDIHDALKFHREPNSVHTGITWDADGKATPMTSEDMRSFNHKSAMNDLLRGAPANKGLVVVNHTMYGSAFDDVKRNRYLYDIDSEQLLPHDWKYPDES